MTAYQKKSTIFKPKKTTKSIDMKTTSKSKKIRVLPKRTKVIEKPSHDLLINTGLYFFEQTILDYITPNTQLDATDLIQSLISNSKRIGIFPINSESWSDFGQWDELKNKLF